MEYEVLTEDYGQGAGLIALPVSKNIGEKVPDIGKPYTAYEVLTEFFGEDMSLVLGNYVKMEQKKLWSRYGIKNARNTRLLSYSYLFTRSRINQPMDRTVVDFILKGDVEAEIRESKRFTRTLYFRVRYILNLRPCSQKCIGPVVFMEEPGKGVGDSVKDLRSAASQKFDPVGIPANDYLLPILYAGYYERVAHEILQIFYPERQNALASGECFPMSIRWRMAV